MTEFPYILFNQSPEQMRQLGACGGRAYARNQRPRRALVATPPETVPPPAIPAQTTAEAIHLLDTPKNCTIGVTFSPHSARTRIARPGFPSPLEIRHNSGIHTVRVVPVSLLYFWLICIPSWPRSQFVHW
jgi:hypothetical protein